MSEPRVTLYDLQPPKPDMLQEVVSGLSSKKKKIDPKYLYDQKGSELFDAITRQPEYYLTRTEEKILTHYADEIHSVIGEDAFLVEFGSGSSAKSRILLTSIRPCAYMPIDISKQYLQESVNGLSKDYPWLDIRATCADYSQDFELPWSPEGVDPVIFFSGSSIGNFSPSDAIDCMKRINRLAGRGGGLLIGIDREKAEDALHAAYNDANGVTATFSLNALQHINHKLDSNFSIEGFEHEARYNSPKSRIEIYLRSLRNQQVWVGDRQFHFDRDERILLEYSHKYTPESFLEISKEAGFTDKAHWTDSNEYFSVFFLAAD